MFIQPMGICYQIKDYDTSNKIGIESTEKLKVFVVDPYTANDVMIETTGIKHL